MSFVSGINFPFSFMGEKKERKEMHGLHYCLCQIFPHREVVLSPLTSPVHGGKKLCNFRQSIQQNDNQLFAMYVGEVIVLGIVGLTRKFKT